jgi:hypothetical protein
VIGTFLNIKAFSCLMSTVMYAFRIKKDDWWDFASKAKEFYIETGLVSKGLANLRNGPAKSRQKFNTLRSSLDLLLEIDGAELQVFDENEEHYLFRVLEKGYRFMNNFQKMDWPIHPVFYDNRADVPEEDEANEKVADWLDEEIQHHRYFIYPLVAKNDLARMLSDYESDGGIK